MATSTAITCTTGLQRILTKCNKRCILKSSNR